jgi:hypothetical protein
VVTMSPVPDDAASRDPTDAVAIHPTCFSLGKRAADLRAGQVGRAVVLHREGERDRAARGDLARARRDRDLHVGQGGRAAQS